MHRKLKLTNNGIQLFEAGESFSNFHKGALQTQDIPDSIQSPSLHTPSPMVSFSTSSPSQLLNVCLC